MIILKFATAAIPAMIVTISISLAACSPSSHERPVTQPLSSSANSEKAKDDQADEVRSTYLQAVATWPMLMQGKLEAHTFSVQFFDLLWDFRKATQPVLSKREQKLDAMSQLPKRPLVVTVDVDQLANWIQKKRGFDIRKEWFMIDSELRLDNKLYDIDKEQWKIDRKEIEREYFDASTTSSVGGYVGTNTFGQQTAVSRSVEYPRAFRVEIPRTKDKLSEKITIPMVFEDAKCQTMKIYYKVLPSSKPLEFIEPKQSSKSPTFKDPTEVMYMDRTHLALFLSEIRIYCTGTKKLLWEQKHDPSWALT